MENARITTLDKTMSFEEVLNFMENIESEILPCATEAYLTNFLIADTLSKMGENKISNKIINYNRSLENELGKYYFASSIINFDTEKYEIAKEFMGESFNMYSPIKIKMGSIKQVKVDGGISKLIEVNDYKIIAFHKSVINALDEQYKTGISEKKQNFP
ncbi:MAG: hypothetical protein Q8Q04_00515 [archaeon]|nr:hypothetical protein [archaeon]